jgi:3'-phosphoadenosine 5'-phosphosulfate sulfotransferase (PAPS reductase)/FAD synthetase
VRAFLLRHLAISNSSRLRAYIILEAVAESENPPVCCIQSGKDSCALLHLALKAFYPAKLPFPPLHAINAHANSVLS